MYDLLFKNGRVVDGTGNPWFYASVGVTAGRIQAMGDLQGAAARRTLDLDGTVLAPGFIDLHTHSDFTLGRFPRAESYLRQGVTTHVVGNCGFSTFPIEREKLDLFRKYSAFLDYSLPYDWKDAAGYIAFLEELPLSSNVVLMVGHGAVRIATLGFDPREPTSAELGKMERMVAQAMEEGAFAFSSGLIYVPGSYCKTDELVALAKVAARYGVFYATHIRGEGDTLLPAVEEALSIGRQAGLPVHLSHHKAMGQRNWGKSEATLAMIDAARARGQDVTADQYPYMAGSTTITALMPPWAMAGGVAELLGRLADPATRARVRQEIVGQRAGTEAFDLEGVMISLVPDGPHKPYEGLMLPEIPAQRGEVPVDTLLYLVESERGAVMVILFGMAEEDVRRIMRHPAVAIASDGWALNPTAGGQPHPRCYGTFARVLGQYVRQEGLLSLEEAVRKMTSLPAQRLGLHDRGLVRPGCTADLVVFDPERVADCATYQDPHRFCEGVSHVVVGGHVVVDGGQDAGAKAGRVLRRGRP